MMQRITKRNKDGGVSIDGMTLALNRLAEYEDTGLEPFEIGYIKDCYDLLIDLNSCNDCGIPNCKYKPKEGEPVRWNCVVWVPKKEDDPYEAKSHSIDEILKQEEVDNGGSENS